MNISILATKLFIPNTRSGLVRRPRLIEKLNEGLQRKLNLVSAPAGFGKTTLVSEWVDNLQMSASKEDLIVNRIAWLSLDDGDNDPKRFLTYFITALSRIEGIETTIGEGALNILHSNQLPLIRDALTSLINELIAIPDRIILVLDDYHVIESPLVDSALNFLIENLPLQMHLVITTREDPNLILTRLRARGQMTEIRADELRFTIDETAAFLDEMMSFNLSGEDVAALEARTEGWIAGL
ncbi:MAG: NACHT domain-containing protein, partial [Spirochaetales bacterium]|nr:NACHT domain-containing protein [Spirochaetales bacterium]